MRWNPACCERDCPVQALIATGAPEADAEAAVQGLAHAREGAAKADLAAFELRLTRWVVVSGGIFTAISPSLLKFVLAGSSGFA